MDILREDDRVELIAGQVVEITPIGDRHASCVRRLNRLISRTVLDAALLDVQNPVVLGEHDAPQPDLVLLRPRADAYPRHPRAPDTLLVIEVADTLVAYDRDVKVPLYGRPGNLPPGSTPVPVRRPAATSSPRWTSPRDARSRRNPWVNHTT